MRITGFFLLFLFALSAFGDWSRVSSSEFSLKPPPVEGSALYKKDFKVLLAEQEVRTEEDCELSRSQTTPSFQNLFGTSHLFSKRELHEVEPFLTSAMKFTERVSNYFKSRFQRPRPFNVDTDIVPCVEKPGGAKAYPSSHAAMASLGACVLSKIFGDRSKKIVEYGDSIGYLRVKVGVHHPSDVEAGQKLAGEICERLMEEEDFHQEVDLLIRLFN